MTPSDLQLVFSALTAILIFGLLWTAILLNQAIRDWRYVEKSGLNGPRQIIAMAAIRRNLTRIALHLGLIWLYGNRVIRGHSAGPASAMVVGLLFTFILVSESIYESVDRRVIRWFLRHAQEDAL